MVDNIGSRGSALENSIIASLSATGEREQLATAIGTTLSNREDELLRLYSIGEISDPQSRLDALEKNGLGYLVPRDANGEIVMQQKTDSQGNKLTDKEGKPIMEMAIPQISSLQQAAQITYKRAMVAFESFQTLMKSAFDTMQRAIQNLRVG